MRHSKTAILSFSVTLGLACTLGLAAIWVILTRLGILTVPGESLLQTLAWATFVYAFVFLAVTTLNCVALFQKGPRKLPTIGLGIQVAILMVVCAGIWTQPMPVVSGATIVEHGIYRFELSSPEIRNDSTSDKVPLYRHASLVGETDTIPICMGTSFGIKYRIDGSPVGGNANLQIVYQYPPPGLRDSSTGQHCTSFIYHSSESIGDTLRAIFTFEHTWELAAGTWAIEIWDANRQLAKREFICIR